MAHDPALAARVRAALTDRGIHEVREVKMFGGLAVMVDDRMLVCVSAGGSDLLVRVGPNSDAQHLHKPGAQRAHMGKDRSMGPGWITVDEQALEEPEGFTYWLHAALAFHAQSSPAGGTSTKRTSKTLGSKTEKSGTATA